MAELEYTIENAIVQLAKDYGMLVFKLNNKGSDGWPDRLFVEQQWGIHFYIEFKAPGEETRPLQDHRIVELLKRNCNVYVVDNKEVGVSVVNYYDDGRRVMDAAHISGACCILDDSAERGWSFARSWARED